MASARPPRNGPICRHCIPLNNFSSIAPAGVGDGPAVRGDGLAANVLESAKTTAARNSWANNRRRKLDVIIRLRWESCGDVQLECRANISRARSAAWAVVMILKRVPGDCAHLELWFVIGLRDLNESGHRRPPSSASYGKVWTARDNRMLASRPIGERDLMHAFRAH